MRPDIAPAARALPAASDRRPLRCLVIDDNMIDRYLICHALNEAVADVEIGECATAASARARLAEECPDIILADRLLPDGDGSEFIALAEAGTPVLILSGESAQDLSDLMTDRSSCRFLHKDDLNPRSLGAVLSDLMGGAAEVIPIRPDVELTDAAARAARIGSPLARGLRLLRTVRTWRDRAGKEDVAELLHEIEGILVRLDDRRAPGGPRAGPSP